MHVCISLGARQTASPGPPHPPTPTPPHPYAHTSLPTPPLQVFGVPNVSARFGTAPDPWNWGMVAAARLLPKSERGPLAALTRRALALPALPCSSPPANVPGHLAEFLLLPCSTFVCSP